MIRMLKVLQFYSFQLNICERNQSIKFSLCKREWILEVYFINWGYGQVSVITLIQFSWTELGDGISPKLVPFHSPTRDNQSEFRWDEVWLGAWCTWFLLCSYLQNLLWFKSTYIINLTHSTRASTFFLENGNLRNSIRPKFPKGTTPLGTSVYK